MFSQFDSPCGRASAHKLNVCLKVLAALLLTMILPCAFAQVTHVANPFVGASQYASPDYAFEVNSVIATETAGSTLAEQMAIVAEYPTAIWMDHIGAIYGGKLNQSLTFPNGRLGLQAHINAALAQQNGSQPIVLTLVIYDLPDRDCESPASTGELSIAGNDTPIGTTTPLAGTGIEEYENDFITPIYNILEAYSTNPNLRFVLVIEPDSLANMITNTGQVYSDANCIAANNGQSWPNVSMSGVYVEGIQYALNQFHNLPNVYTYLDAANAGWLGFTADLEEAAPIFHEVAQGTVDGVSSIDGFVADTSSYVPTKEPYLTATEVLFGSPVDTATFYQGNPNIDEEDYAATFDSALIAAGFPTTLGMLIDTSRNGWGGPLRPTGPPTAYPVSETLNEYVNAAKVDERSVRTQWCNVENAGLGTPPTPVPGYFANLEAYVWLKPPGESDGTYPGSVFNGVTETNGNPECSPTCDAVVCQLYPTGSIPNSPPKGVFFPAEFTQLVQDAYPPVSIGPPILLGNPALSVVQGASISDTITMTLGGGFTGSVTLAASGLPSGVTAVFAPNPTTANSVLTLTASSTATVGRSIITITGTSGAVTVTSTITLTVVQAPGFTLTPSAASLSVIPGISATDTITVTGVNGFTGSVTLAASGLPSGVTAAFATNPTTGTSVLTLTVSSTATFAAATVTITGTSGALTATTTVNLVVDGCETTGLSLTSSPTALSVTQGGTATDTITVIEYCFNGSTTLSAAGLPAGVTATFTPNPTTSQTSLLKLTATSTAAAGTSFLTIIGASGSIVANTTISLTVIAKPAPGFTLAASPSTLAISQGKSATGTITVTDVDGFTGSVTLAASGLPSGVTAAFATNPAKATSVLTLTASSTATVGVSTVTVTGTSGTLKATTSIALTVNPSVGFTLAPSASTLTIVQGSSGADTINVTDFGGFTGRVTLAATGLPGGVTATFNANPATGTSVLTLKTSSTATDGTSTVTVTGTSGSHTATAAITLTVSTPAGPFSISPSAPTLSIVQGGSGTETIALVGFAGSVELYMSNPGLPAGVTYAFAPNPTTTGSSVLTLTASATAAPGTYAITIEGIDGSLSEALTSFTLNVTAAPSGTACHIGYSITGQWAGGFEVALTINNTGTTALSSWVLTWTIPNGQTITQLWNGVETQNGANITVKNESYNDSIPAGGSYAGVGFDGTSNNLTNAAPTSFALNGTVCTVN